MSRMLDEFENEQEGVNNTVVKVTYLWYKLTFHSIDWSYVSRRYNSKPHDEWYRFECEKTREEFRRVRNKYSSD